MAVFYQLMLNLTGFESMVLQYMLSMFCYLELASNNAPSKPISRVYCEVETNILALRDVGYHAFLRLLRDYRRMSSFFRWIKKHIYY